MCSSDLAHFGGGAQWVMSSVGLQMRAPDHVRGRVLSVYNVTVVGTTPIGAPFVGWLCQMWGPRWGFAISGFAAFVAIGAFGIPFLRACARRPSPYEQSELPGGDDHVVLEPALSVAVAAPAGEA